MKFVERKIKYPAVRSLVWQDGDLIDWVAGGTRFSSDGSVTRPPVSYAGDFDAAIATSTGDIAVVYKRLGTKAIVLNDGEVVREINRSYYQAHAYEYPLCLWEREGQPTMIIHCPGGYNQLEIEEAVSGQRLSNSGERNPPDFFHSRLSINPSGTHLMSAGWVWHPMDAANIYRLPEFNAKSDLDTPYDTVDSANEISACSWVNDELILAANSESLEVDEEEEFAPGSLGCWSIKSRRWSKLSVPDTKLGQLMPLGEDYVVSFYEYPKLIRVSDGAVVSEWPHIHSGKQTSSIICHIDSLPPIAIDSSGLRFAVASDKDIHVVSFEAD